MYRKPKYSNLYSLLFYILTSNMTNHDYPFSTLNSQFEDSLISLNRCSTASSSGMFFSTHCLPRYSEILPRPAPT